MGAAGTALISEITGSVSTPTLGIGGINETNVADVIAAGAAGVAVIGAILGAETPRAAAETLATEAGLKVAAAEDKTNQ